MLLAIDVGNTNTVFALFEGEHLIHQWRLVTDPRKTADEYGLALTQLMDMVGVNWRHVKWIVICTVVPNALFSLKRLCKHYFGYEPLVVGENGMHVGIPVKIDRATEVGADRLVNSVQAYRLCGGNTIVVDFGTATTFDVIDEEGCYIGGVIAPGINLSVDALHQAAAKLPKVAIGKPPLVIGTSTVSAMQSGVYWGYMGLIEGLIERICIERKCEMKTIATGGLASLFFNGTDSLQRLEPDLTVHGLQYIFAQNMGEKG